MKLDTLRYFLAVAEYGSFTKASERLYVTQPTLSRQIQELEEELGAQLFRRDYKKLSLTDDGRAFQSAAEDIIERCERASRMFKGEEKPVAEKAQKLRIGYQRHFNSQQVYDVMQGIMLEHPGLDFMLEQGAPAALVKALDEGKIDAAFILNVFLPKDTSGLRVVPFQHNRLQLIVPKRHPLAGRKRVSIGELRDETFVLMNRAQSPVLVDYIAHLCRQSGFTPHAKHYFDDAMQGIELVAAGRGISFLHSGMYIDMYQQYYQIVPLDIEEADLKLDFVAVCKKDNRNDILMQLFEALNIE